MKLFLVILVVAVIHLDSCNAQGRRITNRNSDNSRTTSENEGYNNRRITGTGRGGGSRDRVPTYETGNNRRNTNDDDDDDDEDYETDTDRTEFECPTADGLFPDPEDCQKFYICGGYRPWSQACPPALYFDARKKFCTFKTADLACGPLSAEEQAKKFNGTNQIKLPRCDQNACQLPHCFCSNDGTRIPGNLEPTETPQMILLGFSGAINTLVFDKYKKSLGYNLRKYKAPQSKLNPNGCGIKATFFVNHEYSNYAEVQWLATQGHEIGIHSITHREPEGWWTERANYSDWAEEIIGQREIIIKFANGGSPGPNGDGVLNRDNIIGMRAPYMKPGGDAMLEMAHDFGLLYDSSIVAPQGRPPLWPFTWDYRQPFSCGKETVKKTAAAAEAGRQAPEAGGADFLDTDINRGGRGGGRRNKRSAPFLGAPLHCPSKPYPGLWEIPVNPLYNEFNTCPTLDQCVFPSSDENDDAKDITEFMMQNFERHYSTNRAPFLLNFHVNWFTQKNKVRGLRRFINKIISDYKDTYFVTYQQMIDWMRNPEPIATVKFDCPKVNNTACNRPQSCAIKHPTNADHEAAETNVVSEQTRYMALCAPTACPGKYPWFGNHAGQARNFKTIMELVEEALADTPSDAGAQ